MAGLYIHIPFCHSKCIYCDFYSTPAANARDRVVDAIVRELDNRINEVDEDIVTVYIGGGTPSILDVYQLEKIVYAISKYVNLDHLSEFTIEANPEDITADKIKKWVALGINRVSMGVQSFVDDELHLIGRRHDAQCAYAAAKTLADNGISNFSLDLIYGLPGQTLESWEYSLDRLLSLHPRHFSAYMLSYEPGTRLSLMLKRGEMIMAPEDLLIDMYRLLCDKARQHGYEHYEISNFCQPGWKAKHNSAYWNGTPYIGLGPSAHSFDGSVRRVNPPSITTYLSHIEAGGNAYEIDAEDDDNKFNDIVITSLRTSAGLDLSRVSQYRLKQLMKDAKPYLHSNALTLTNNTLRIPEEMWLISDNIIAALFQV